jgi:hypothetical protein
VFFKIIPLVKFFGQLMILISRYCCITIINQCIFGWFPLCIYAIDVSILSDFRSQPPAQGWVGKYSISLSVHGYGSQPDLLTSRTIISKLYTEAIIIAGNYIVVRASTFHLVSSILATDSWVSQKSVESRRFTPGAQVSSHRESLQRGLG